MLVDGGTKLWCKQCPKQCGSFVPTNKIPLDECDFFGNSNGRLVCDLPPNQEGEGPAQLPNGSYMGSCGGCHVGETVRQADNSQQWMLTCAACKNTEGGTNPSELVLDGCNQVGNNNGQLVCEEMTTPARKLAHLDGLPEGPYLDTCSGCKYATETITDEGDEYNVLRCAACQKTNGGVMASEIVLKSPCSSLLWNRNGRLTCAPRTNMVHNHKTPATAAGEETVGVRVSMKHDDGVNREIYQEHPLAEGWKAVDGELVHEGDAASAAAAAASHDEL